MARPPFAERWANDERLIPPFVGYRHVATAAPHPVLSGYLESRLCVALMPASGLSSVSYSPATLANKGLLSQWF